MGDDGEAAPRTILLVEDVAPLRFITALFLRRGGYTVLEAEDGRGALALIADASLPLDLLLTDLHLPDMDGRSLVERAIAIRPTLHVLYSSGSGSDARSNADLIGDHYQMLNKPYTSEQLLSTVEKVLKP